VRTAFDGDLHFVHRFQQRRLRFGRGAVDFIGQKKIRENRAGFELKLLALRVVNGDAQHVARKHVAGELEPVKAAMHGTRQACASVVLPTPGTSSISKCPRASKHTMESRTTSGFPRMVELSDTSNSLSLESVTGAATIIAIVP
jgi:hypothetical protein